ncbi:MAG: amidase [Gemmatimonadetes bacterium]|nr:amidase [Gemmatimonadota bacterium]|tara:strand:- start:68477 stop:70123 length:1647 start_codon:yes stop_codon:yes gene_type:complete
MPRSSDDNLGMARELQRRSFLKMAAGVGLGVGAVSRESTNSNINKAVPNLEDRIFQEALSPLGNGESPCLQFQANPGGTGALLDRLWKEDGGSPSQISEIGIDPWTGPLPTNPAEIAFLPVDRLAALIRQRKISSVELTEIYLDRMKKFDPTLLCAVTILEDRAYNEAKKADRELQRGQWRGPLHGIPWGVKDLFSVTGAPTTWGSEDFKNQVIDEDAELVVRLRQAGAVLIAKLATGRFAAGDNWYRGETRNAWNTNQGSSGSSAGPGSATAAGLVGFSIGTETQGSIVGPSRRGGLSALRPTFGRVSRHGGMVLSWSMDKPGPMCRSIKDCALVFNAIHGSDEKDPSTLTAPFRFQENPDIASMAIGYTPDAPQAFLDKLQELGANPKPMTNLPEGRSNALSVESSAAFDFYVAPDGELEEVPQSPEGEEARVPRFHGGRSISALEFVQSQRRRRILMQEMAEAMEGFDMFVTGSGETRLTNQTGHPAVVLPFDFGDSNSEDDFDHEQPICTTIIGNLFADDKILSVSHLYQSVTDWHQRHPPGLL